jgi:hypothetical protein
VVDKRTIYEDPSNERISKDWEKGSEKCLTQYTPESL